MNGPFDIGHIPEWEHRRLEEAAKQLGLTSSRNLMITQIQDPTFLG